MSRIGTARGADLARFRALVHDLAWRASRGDWPAAISYLTQARDMLPARHAARAGLDRQIATLRDRASRAATAVERARTAWLTAGRDTELDRWRDLYELAVPRPRPAERNAA